MSQTETGALPVPHRLSAIESTLAVITGTLDKLGPILSALIPASAPFVAGVDAVGHVAEEVIETLDGSGTVDAASLAAHGLTKSTGNVAMDTRLMQIETVLVAAVPVLKYIASEFGLSFDVPTAAPMTLDTATDAPAVTFGEQPGQG